MNNFVVEFPKQNSEDVKIFLSGMMFPSWTRDKEHSCGTHDFINISIEKPEWKGFYKFRHRWTRWLTVLTETNKVYFIYYKNGTIDMDFNDFRPFIKAGMTLDELMDMYML